MVRLGKTDRGQFCWLDLAATNADRAKTFYRKLFGWTSHEQQANGGSFTRLRLSDQDVARSISYGRRSWIMECRRTGPPMSG
jgi:Predicted enzyme related to lactoylglutathione lyase